MYTYPLTTTGLDSNFVWNDALAPGCTFQMAVPVDPLMWYAQPQSSPK
jgi:hypothetical protein